MNRFSKYLHVGRASSGKTQEAVAAEIGINTSTYARIEQGEAMHVGTFLKIIDWLFGEEPPKVPPQK